MHRNAAALLPELSEWNEGRGIPLDVFRFSVGRYDHAVAYAEVFWPDFILHDGCILRYEPDLSVFKDWMESLKGDRSRVEAVMNHLHILDMFTTEHFEPTQEIVSHLAGVLKDMWSCKLIRDFPDRRISVETYVGDTEDLLTYEITFFQERSG